MKTTKLLFAFAGLAALTGCGNDIRDTLGLTKEAPDEFVVVSRPPLVVPPDFELKPPSSEATDRGLSTENQAQQTLFGAAANASPSATSAGVTATGATASFLNKAGAGQASPDIRQQLGADTKAPVPTNKQAGSLYEQIIGEQKTDAVVDSAKEAKRLQENKDAGKPVTDGDTPVVNPGSKSVLDKIF